MNDPFEKRVRAAAAGLWWTIVLTVVALWLQWWLFRRTSTNPQWFHVWVVDKSGLSFQEMRAIWLWMLIGLKSFVWLAIFIATWLTLWARQMRKQTGGSGG
jgi:hypothetical protein